MKLTTATELLADWDRQIAELTVQAENRRNNGMLDSAALLRTQRDTLKQCADALRQLVKAPLVITAATAAKSPQELPLEVAALIEFPLMPEAEFSERLQLLQNSLLSEPSAKGPNGDLEGWADQTQAAAPALSTDPAPPPAAHSTLQESASPNPSLAADSAQSAASSSPQPGSKVSSDSSAQDGDACGDINCDGHCKPQMLRPRLIYRIDICKSEEAARNEESLATPAQRRMAARFLHVDLHDLPGALARRVRTRLQQAA
ncbi:MAG: hypothetical protein K9N47_05650 [Prosthecobacter sp.]|uniref:hypothetical protein n=1 Tax=Prosthecobacter sp. TaxID=1965333 RepID=UPI0025D13C07|nr:hypothetical protein [Prosthecobacter sp.]MCF7785585.1 hypothetical protein [Prosthecobacter sp.]